MELTSIGFGEVCINLGDQGWFDEEGRAREALKLLMWWWVVPLGSGHPPTFWAKPSQFQFRPLTGVGALARAFWEGEKDFNSQHGEIRFSFRIRLKNEWETYKSTHVLFNLQHLHSSQLRVSRKRGG